MLGNAANANIFMPPVGSCDQDASTNGAIARPFSADTNRQSARRTTAPPIAFAVAPLFRHDGARHCGASEPMIHRSWTVHGHRSPVTCHHACIVQLVRRHSRHDATTGTAHPQQSLKSRSKKNALSPRVHKSRFSLDWRRNKMA